MASLRSIVILPFILVAFVCLVVVVVFDGIGQVVLTVGETLVGD